jgi:hypothetical protein
MVYWRRLPAASSSDTRMPQKHEIRRRLHLQIKELWQRHPELLNRREALGCLACALDILFLRRDVPGRVIGSGGDIDNRLKVLFDALRIPMDCTKIPPSWIPDDEEDPLHCLLDDDKLITTLNVTTDQLLTPMEEGEAVNDVVLVIQVRAIITDFERAPWGFIA